MHPVVRKTGEGKTGDKGKPVTMTKTGDDDENR
jgi:hypothetical protein